VKAGLELAREDREARLLRELETVKPARVSLEREAEIRAQLPPDVAAELDALGVFRSSPLGRFLEGREALPDKVAPSVDLGPRRPPRPGTDGGAK